MVLVPCGVQEIKAGDAARTRALFERAITVQLPPKKMKVRCRICHVYTSKVN